MEEKKVVLITGGAMGQGRAHAYKYAENGFNVVLADMLEPSHEAFKETIANCEAKGAKVLAKKANITSTEDMEALFASAWETFGRLDVVIANAGVINFGYTWELTDEQVEKVMDINLIGTWRTDKYAAQYMLKQGFGRIINISSTSGLYGTPQLATYCMSKWGILGLTKTLAKEVGSKGIIVNADDVSDREALEILVDKACICRLHTNHYGIKARLSWFDDTLMHLVYLKKYSKQKQS